MKHGKEVETLNKITNFAPGPPNVSISNAQPRVKVSVCTPRLSTYRSLSVGTRSCRNSSNLTGIVPVRCRFLKSLWHETKRMTRARQEWAGHSVHIQCPDTHPGHKNSRQTILCPCSHLICTAIMGGCDTGDLHKDLQTN